MANENDKPGKAKLDRRSLLLGGGVGAVGVGAVTVGAQTVKHATQAFVAPSAVKAGEAPVIGESYADSHPALTEAVSAPAGAPNIVVIILDDVGFADFGCYGGDIETPALDALAKRGLRYANFRTTAMCSCTRASLLTGLNHHSAGMGWLADIDSGYPGYRGDLTREAAALPEVLKDAGWSTFLVGKWHVNYVESNGPAGPFHNWPTNRGFEQAYWFQGHSTDYWKPGALYDGLTQVEAPARPGYYVTDDLTDRAIEYVRTQRLLSEKKPFFLQLAYSGAHSPLHSKPEDRDHYKGRFDKGWDAVRAERLARQKAMGIVAQEAELPPLSFGAEPWDSLTPIQKKVYARYMEVYAGVIAGLDRNIGRLMGELEALGVAENTLVVVFSDNGGSAEGTPTGTPNVIGAAIGDTVSVEEAAKLYDIMGEEGTFPHYPIGWTNASNTPYRLYKQYTALGGVADPLIVSWPKRITDQGKVRKPFVHVVDLYPTLLEAAGVQRASHYRGRPQKPMEGKSFVSTFADPNAPTRTEQYYELGGYRAYQDGNWRLVAVHKRGDDFAKDHWALFDISKDPTEVHDLAEQHPEVARTLKAKWEDAARRYHVYPLDDRNLIIKMMQTKTKNARRHWDIRPPIRNLPGDVAPNVCGIDHVMQVEFERPKGVDDGVLVAHGSGAAGYSLYLKGGRLYYETSVLPRRELIEGGAVPTGRVVVRYEQKMTKRPSEGSGHLYVNGEKRADHSFQRVIATASYDGFSVGSDPGGQVSKAYTGPNPYPARIDRVKIDIDMKPPTLAETLSFMKQMQIKV